MSTWRLHIGPLLARSGSVQAWFPEPVRASPVDPLPDPADSAGTVAWEVACIGETQRGEPDAFNPLVAHYAPRIRAYLYRMVRNHEEAEDLTQETFLKAYRGLRRFDNRRPFKPWLYTIATNTGLNALRHRERQGTPVDLDADALRGPHVGENRRGSDPVSGRRERLDRALEALPARARQLVTLHYHEGFTLREAGAVLGMTENAAKVALCRARRRLREMVAKGVDDAV